MRHLLLAFGVLWCWSSLAQAETKVTTYVIKTQEERESTRFTLTEWLRIKERMKMMDVWMAMFSNPQKDQFAPELSLHYASGEGLLSHNLGSDTIAMVSTQARGQLWLTNIISGTVGIKTLNLDFGIEGLVKETKKASLETAGATPSTNVQYGRYTPRLRSFTGNFRLFGRNIQDSSLIVKYGQYRRDGHYSLMNNNANKGWEGLVAGAELSVYILRWLGLEGSYWAFGDGNSAVESTSISGEYYDYTAFLEVSLLRFFGGYYREKWDVTQQGIALNTDDQGMVMGLKIQL